MVRAAASAENASRARVRRAAVVVLAPAAVVIASAACSASASAVDKGGSCFETTDCADGLVCVPQKNSGSICTDDLSGVAGRPPAEGGAGEAGEGGRDGAPAQDGQTPSDSGGTDTGVDTGSDTGTTIMDAGSDG